MSFLLKRFDWKRIFTSFAQILLILAVSFYLILFFADKTPKTSLRNQFLDDSTSDWKAIHQMEIDYWKTIRAETMTPQQILDYFRWNNHTACEIIHYFGGVITNWNNVTGIDGQYPVCLDVEVRPAATSSTPCLVYSFGIRDEWSFEEALERYGCEIFAFDPSMNKGDHDHSSKIHFYKLGLGPKDSNSTTGWTLKTLDSIYRMLKPRHGGKVIDYLKIDIEWNEWDALKQILTTDMLAKVRQLSVEFHLPHQDASKNGYTMTMTLDDYRSLVQIVKSIEKQMTRYTSRSIPWGDRPIKSFNNYNGNVCFEMSFHQILPYS